MHIPAFRLRLIAIATSAAFLVFSGSARADPPSRIARLGYWEWDVARRGLIASEECFRLLGRTPVPASDIASVCDVAELFQYLHTDDRGRVAEIVARALSEGGSGQFECRVVRIDHAVRTVLIEIETERGADGTMSRVYGVIQDISERKRTEDQIRVLANYDSLTGLSNRRLFHEQFTLAIEHARRDNAPVVLLFIDLDRLRQINDTLGHAAGDQLLKEVALRLQRSIRDRGLQGSSADVVARLGSDQFGIMLTGLSGADEAEAVAQCVQAALHEPTRLLDQECVTSASIGISAYPRDGDDAETLMHYAAIAMNAAKASGMNTLQVYKAGLHARSRDRLMLEQALHKALGRDELVMHYQPQIDTRLGAIIGAEALMRWQSDGRLVPPGDFIGIAEEIGLIVPFGEWAINDVMAQNRAWIDAGFEPLPIAVNISGNHFERSNFVDLVREALTRQQIAPEYLELEITETTLMRNLSSTLPALDALTALGMRLSVDDFGTGYSSLSYLRRLPIDTLKIDGSFVRELQKGSDSEAIVAAIIAMAKSLELRVIAEGVETEEQMRLLQAHGCHIMQGFYFSKPVPAAELWHLADTCVYRAKAEGRNRVVTSVDLQNSTEASPDADLLDFETRMRVVSERFGEELALRGKQMAKRYREEAERDGLTGLYNRRHLDKRLPREMESAIRHKRKLSLVMLDLDHFGEVNRTYGFPGGDRALRLVASAVGASIRSVDWVARYGGEEFCVVMPDTPLVEGLAVAERLREAIRKEVTHAFDGREISVTASMGVVELDGDRGEAYTDPVALIQAASDKVREAKNGGRDRVCS